MQVHIRPSIVLRTLCTTKLIVSIPFGVTYCKLIIGTNVSYKLSVSILRTHYSGKGEIFLYEIFLSACYNKIGAGVKDYRTVVISGDTKGI